MNGRLSQSTKSGIFGLALMTGVTICGPLRAGEPDGLIGNWKLVSWQVIAEDGTAQDVFGAKPKAGRNGRLAPRRLAQVNAGIQWAIPG
jgi:hypothetical protein